jgi:hypothetical protein
MLMRIYFESQDKKIYSVRKICRLGLTDKVTNSGRGINADKNCTPLDRNVP